MNRTTKQASHWLLWVAITALVSVPAFAAGGEEGSGGLFSGDLGNAIWTTAIFLGLLLVLGKFAWTPILDGMKQREDFIHDSLAKAKADRDEAAAQLAKYDNLIAEARAEATSIVEEGRRDAEVLQGRIEEKAKAEAEQLITRAKREIGISKDTAIKELYALSGTLATDIASRIVRRELTPADQQRLIEESIAELGGLESN